MVALTVDAVTFSARTAIATERVSRHLVLPLVNSVVIAAFSLFLERRGAK